jgi:hypothetical protein
VRNAESITIVLTAEIEIVLGAEKRDILRASASKQYKSIGYGRRLRISNAQTRWGLSRIPAAIHKNREYQDSSVT